MSNRVRPKVSSNVVLTLEHLQRVVAHFLKQDAFAFDVETMGEHRGDPIANQVVWMALATHGMTVVIPMGHPNGDVMVEKPTRKKNRETNKFEMTPARWDEAPKQLRPSQVFKALLPLFMSPTIIKIAHNATFDLGSVAKYFNGMLPIPPYADTIVQNWLLNENTRNGLKDVTLARYKRKYDSENVGRKIEIHPFSKVARYAFMDVKFTWLHWLHQRNAIEDDSLSDVYALEMDLLEVLLAIGQEGTDVDVERMRELEVDLSERKTDIEGRLYKAAGKKFNINSNPQKVMILYGPKSEGNQGLKPWRLTKGALKRKSAADKRGAKFEPVITDYSTDKEALETYPRNKVASTLLEYQEVVRVLGTYIQGYLGVEGDAKKPGMIFDGRVYPDFVQYGTVTGRFSCRTPNLQNIPRPDTDLGKAVRSLFVAPEGHRLLVADYGAIEMVLLAHFAGPGALWDGFFNKIDPHTMTAALVFGVDPEDVTPAMRQAAKAINFAVVYGAGPVKVAAMAKVSEAEAKRFLRTHEREFPEIYKFKDRVISTCRDRSHPHIKTILGRKRRLPSIWSKDYSIRGKAERQAVNSLIQGSAADLIKMAMVDTYDNLRAGDTGRLLLTVHDELVVKAQREVVAEAEQILRDSMTGPEIQKWVRVPLSIDLKVVDKWSEAKDG